MSDNTFASTETALERVTLEMDRDDPLTGAHDAIQKALALIDSLEHVLREEAEQSRENLSGTVQHLLYLGKDQCERAAQCLWRSLSPGPNREVLNGTSEQTAQQ